MKNWLNQDLHVGDYVHRGAREGNSTALKVGRIRKITEKGVNVLWLFQPSLRYDDARKPYQYIGRMDSQGTGSADGLILLDKTLVQQLELDCMREERDNWNRHRRQYGGGQCWAGGGNYCHGCKDYLDNPVPSVL